MKNSSLYVGLVLIGCLLAGCGGGGGSSTLPTTTATPAGGLYNADQNVTLTPDKPAVVYYTTDGTEPTTSSEKYASAISITANTTLKFFAKDTAGKVEKVKTEVYMIEKTSPPLSDTVRQMQVGDKWIYEVTGTATEGSDSIDVAGTLTKTVTSETEEIAGGEDARVITWSGTISGDGYTNTLDTKEYLTQDADGSIWTYGGEDSGGVYWIVPEGTGRNEYVWSPLVINRTWGSHKETSDGESYDISFTVTGEATTTVPAGEYDTYTVEGTGMFAGSPSVEELWWAPQIGAPVKRHIVAVDSVSGKMLDLTLELKSRNR